MGEREATVNNKAALGTKERWLSAGLVKVYKRRSICDTKRAEAKLLKHKFISSMLQSWRVELRLHQQQR
jgi:hypothetical protein